MSGEDTSHGEGNMFSFVMSGEATSYGGGEASIIMKKTILI